MKRILVFIFPVLLSCTMGQKDPKITTAAPESKSNSAFVWEKLLDSAAWAKSYNFQMFSAGDSLWTFHHDGNWFSLNGKDWTKSPLTNSIYNLAFLDYVQFNDAVYGLGHFEGNIEQFNFRPIVSRTENFNTWDTIALNSNLPKRFFYHPFVFDNKIWILGGEDKYTQYADVWNSADGINWIKQKDNLPFGKRSNAQVVLLKEKLFLIGQDVWSSTDALNWQKETDEILKGEKAFFPGTAIVYADKIWLLGCNRSGTFRNQVFVSENGKDWSGMEAPWSPRGGIAATVHKDKIYMTGGKYGGLTEDGRTTEFIYSNDVWTLSEKK